MFMQRLISKGRLYFDQDMNPTFNSDEGLAALEDMLAVNQYLHPDAFSFIWSSNYNAFGRGEGFMNIVWPSVSNTPRRRRLGRPRPGRSPPRLCQRTS